MVGTLILSSALVPSPAQATESTTETTITVVGTIEASATLSHQAGETRVEGQLLDEQRHPLPGRIAVEGDTAKDFRPCSADGVTIPSTSTTRPRPTSFETDPNGYFCLIARSAAIQAVPILARAPHHRTTRTIISGSAGSIRTRIVRAPNALVAQTGGQHVVEALVLGHDDGSWRRVVANLDLSCGPSRQFIAHATAATNELLRFEFSSDAVAFIGSCHFVITDAEQNAKLGIESVRRPVLVQARVDLELTALDESTREQATAHISARVDAPLGQQAVSGLLEASSQGAFLASCSLQDGACQVSLARTRELRMIEVRFVSTREELIPGEDVSLTLSARAPSPWPAAIKSLLLAAFGAWLLHIWLGHRQRPRDTSVPRGHAGVSQLGPTSKNIHGDVRDAHSGEPIPDADVRLFEIAPSGEQTKEASVTDDAGRFSLNTPATHPRVLRVRVLAEGYVPLDAMVQGSLLRIQLTSHRRAALTGLLRWARAAGFSFHPRIPGPIEISTYAEASATDEVVQWTQDMAKTAYGPQNPTQSDLSDRSERQRR